MINLLPPEAKKEILMERKKKMVLLNWIFVLSLLILSVLAMYAILFYLQDRADSLEAWLEESSLSSEKIANQETLGKIDSFNLSFEKLNAFYRQKVHISEVLEKIAKVLPENIYLKEFSVSPNLVDNSQSKKIDSLNVYISGFSLTREDLLLLESDMKSFEKFNFPLTNLVKAADIDFYLTFKISKP